MSTTTNDPLEGCFAAIIGWTLGWGTGAVRALVAMKGWEWFVADTFDLPTLSFVQTWGLFMLINFATFQFTHSNDKRRPLESVMSNLINSLLMSGFFFISLFILSSLL